MAVDVVFVLQGIIGPIYLADAVIQAVFLIGLGVGYARRRSQPLSG
jgi:hypothetical protein